MQCHWLMGIHGTLAALPSSPTWSINGTTAETGRRFRFKAKECGDYKLGYADSRNFPLSHALAVLARFPGGIGPLVIKASRCLAPPAGLERPRLRHTGRSPTVKRLHLYNGGPYENLGLELLSDGGV
jgi:NTE family protein